MPSLHISEPVRMDSGDLKIKTQLVIAGRTVRITHQGDEFTCRWLAKDFARQMVTIHNAEVYGGDLL